MVPSSIGGENEEVTILVKIVTKNVIMFQICRITDFSRLPNIPIVFFYHDDKKECLDSYMHFMKRYKISSISLLCTIFLSLIQSV